MSAMATPPYGARRRVLAVAAAAAALALVAGCATHVPLDVPPVAEQPPPVPSWVGVRATEADAGRRITVRAGESLALVLRVPAATGAGWVVAEASPGLSATGRLAGPVWPADAPSSPIAPAPVWQVFVFEATTPGPGRVVLELAGTGARPRRLEFPVEVVRP